MKKFAILALIVLAVANEHAFAQDAAPVVWHQYDGSVQDQPKTCEQWCTPFLKAMPVQEAFFDLALAADMLTTLDIKNHPADKMIELNPILGDRPSDGKVIGWCLVAAGLHAAVTYSLVDSGAPPVVVKTWEYITIGIETGMAVHNYSIGLRFRL